MGIAAYGIGSGTLSVPLLSSAIIALGLALVMAQVRSFFRNASLADLAESQRVLGRRIETAEQASRDWNFRHEDLAQQITALRADANSTNARLAQGLDEIRQGHTAIAQQLNALLVQRQSYQEHYVQAAAPTSFSEERPPIEQQVAASQEGTAPKASVSDMPFGDKLTLALEPIIDLYTMQTAHYRMIVSMQNDRGQEVAPEFFLHHAAQTGQRTELDRFVVRESLAILSKLRQRDPNLCLITAIGAATLADGQALRDILQSMADYRDVSAGLVIEVGHAVLASLPEASLEGLATLARAGVTLALSNASIAGADLGALSRLNVRYVSLAAATAGGGLSGFVQAARALRIHVVITQVIDARQMQELSRAARFASGPAFAPPRKLKRVDEAAQGPALTAAA